MRSIFCCFDLLPHVAYSAHWDGPIQKAGKQWAKQFVDPHWAALIDQAWLEREGVRFGVKIGQRAELALLFQSLDFIKYALSQTDTIELQTRLESPPKASA